MENLPVGLSKIQQLAMYKIVLCDKVQYTMMVLRVQERYYLLKILNLTADKVFINEVVSYDY